MMRLLSTAAITVGAVLVRAGLDLIVTPSRPVTAACDAGRAAADDLAARRSAPSWKTHGAPRPRSEVEPDDDTIIALAWIGTRGEQEEWMRTLDDILEAELALVMLIDARRDREDAEVALLDDLFPDRPSWPRGDQ